ncbi:MAG: Ig-like domain-containing protein [Clostridia bacterium]|nr:Ig-like domain-containing protein [Clostridia bacterium]
MKRNMIRSMLVLACLVMGLLMISVPALAEAVNEAPVIFLNGEPVEKVIMNLSEGNQLQFTSDQKVAWKSSKPYRAEIDQSGLLTAESASEIIISATNEDGRKTTCEIIMTRLATGVVITGADEVAAGERITLKAQVLPSNVSKKKVDWSSSDESVATVDSSGRVRANDVSGVKSVVITATARDGSGVSAQHTVTVRPAAERVSISEGGNEVDEIYLDISASPSAQLSAAVYPAEASQQVAWSTSSSSRVKVDENGVITGLKTGTATITATAKDGTGKKTAVKVHVVRMVTGIEILGSDSVLAGRSIELEARVTPSNASEKDVVWTSSDPSVLTVSKYGDVKAQKIEGVHTAVITATAKDGSGVVAQKTITVTPRIDEMTITVGGQPAGERIYLDLNKGMIDLDALIEPAEACQNVTWKSDSAKRAKVDENGVVTALKTGTAVITAYAADGSSVKASVRVTVIRAVESISVTGDTLLAGGERGELEAIVSPKNATEDEVSWVSSNPDVLTVNKYGDIRAAEVTSAHQVTVYAKAKDGSGVVGSTVVTVLPRASEVTVYSEGRPVSTVGIDLAGNTRLQLTAKVGPEESLQQVKWTTSDKKRAAVDENGLVTGLKKGTAVITATATDGSGVRARVTVHVGVMARQIIVSGPAQVSSGKKIELSARILPANVSEDEVAWSSSNTAAAKVNKRGEVTGGVVDVPTQVTITAAATDGSGVKGEYTVTVIPVVRSISIARTDGKMAGSLILDTGTGTAQLSATAYPAAANQKIRWRSSNEKVVTVDANGRVTAHGAGRTTIVAEATDGSGVDAVLWVGVGNLSEIPYYFEVDRTNQVVRVYERGADNTYSTLIKRMICSSGRSSSPGLASGLYSMHGGRMIWMDGVAIYATRIKGSYLFHSVIYHEHNMGALDAAAYEKLGSKASGGCIRLLAGDAKWIYDNVPKGCFVSMMEPPRDINEYGAVSKPPLVSGNWDPTNPSPKNPDFDPTYTSDVKK